MLRFCGEKIVNVNKELDVAIEDKCLVFDENIWENGRKYFRSSGCHGTERMRMIPISNAHGEIICYGWQDLEANRELRMLEELGKKQLSLSFRDVFPDVGEVVVYGCNELAFYFVKYLEKLEIPVSVNGKYWKRLGIECTTDIDLDDCNKMIIHAEHILQNRTDLFQRVIRSASPEFECIDRIYEANVLAGNIKDNEGDFNDLLRKLEGKDIVILGMDEKAQDAYDLICKYDIDIEFFATENDSNDAPDSLLGKSVTSVAELLYDERNRVFLDVHDKNSAWGNRYLEQLDYYGFKRNEQFFFMNDYTEIPCSNLIHVLKWKSVF